ncbi:hypothetical protein XENOCAPTIV_028207, partial [Xenoophorus captivus]
LFHITFVPKPSRLFLHASLLPPNTVTKGCVLSYLLGSFVPTDQQLLYRSWCPPAAENPLSWLSSLFPAQLAAAGKFGLLVSALLFLSLSFPVTNQCRKPFFQLFLSLDIR